MKFLNIFPSIAGLTVVLASPAPTTGINVTADSTITTDATIRENVGTRMHTVTLVGPDCKACDNRYKDCVAVSPFPSPLPDPDTADMPQEALLVLVRYERLLR